jgi:hypothetical protein
VWRTEIGKWFAEFFSTESLSDREVDVLRQVAQGNGNREIGKPASNFRRDSESPHQTHHGEARCERPH